MSAFFLCTSIFAQKMLELLPGSSELVYDESVGAHKLLGGANFIYQGNTMYCDSAYFFDHSKLMRAYGHVHVQKTDQLNLFCDSLQYNTGDGWSKLWGHVRAIDSEYKLTTDSMDFDTRSQQGIYRHGGKIENLLNGEVLTSRVGYFYPNSKNFFFRGNVNYVSKEVKMTTDTLQYKYAESRCYFFGPTDITTEDALIFCESGWYNVQTEEGHLRKNASIVQGSKTIRGDTLNYNPKTKISEGFGHVFFEDTLEQLNFSGNYAFIDDSMHYSYLTGEPIARKVQKNDTLYIHADTIFNQNDSLGERLLTKGYHGVKLFSANMQAIADSMSYEKGTQNMELFKDPVVWSRNGELKGDSIRIFMNDSIIHRIHVIDKATILMEVDSGKYYNQIGGNTITAFFKDNEIYQAIAFGNAQTVFFPEEETKTDTAFIVKRMGMNRLYASELKIYLDSGEVTGITYFEQPDGVFYPMSKIKESEQFIANFLLKFGLRPKSPEDLLMDTRITSTEPEEMEDGPLEE